MDVTDKFGHYYRTIYIYIYIYSLLLFIHIILYINLLRIKIYF
jgi:hypothetical protein